MSPAEKPPAHDEPVADADLAVDRPDARQRDAPQPEFRQPGGATSGSQTADEELLAEMFDRFLEDQFEGRASDLSGVLPLDPELREKASEAYEFAREFVARKATERPKLAGYEILEELGHGGMGSVYLARQESLGRKVALKVLPPALGLSANARKRFLDEARAIARLQDDHIVKIHDVVERDDLLAYAMEWVDGKSLKQLVEELKPHGPRASLAHLARSLSNEQSCFGDTTLLHYFLGLGVTIARALANVHSAGLVHRDVKPSNILIRHDGSALLADFGLARGSVSSVTGTGVFVGTPVYAPPEQLRAGDDEPVDCRADVYALGVTLYEAVALAQPFRGRTTAEVLRRIESGDVQRLHRLAPHVPLDLETILHKAMEPGPQERYQSAGELADDLERLLRLEPIQARPAGAWKRSVKFVRRHGRVLLTAAASAVTVAALAIVTVWYREVQLAIPQRAAQLVQEARTYLLSPDIGRGAWLQIALGIDDPLGPAFLKTDTLYKALDSYDRALDLQPGVGAEVERRVVAFVLELHSFLELEPHASTAGRVEAAERAIVAGGLHRLQVTATATSRIWRRSELPRLDEDAIRAARPTDRKALGLLAYLIGDFVRCERAWECLDTRQGESPLIDAVLGILYQADGRPDRAYPRLLRAVSSFAGAGYLAVDLADAALSLENVALAERILESGQKPAGHVPAEVVWSDYHLRRVQADLMVAQGKRAEARAVYSALAREAPRRPTAEYRLAQLELERGHVDRALSRLALLVTRWPAVARYRLTLAEAALSTGDLPTYFRQVRNVLCHDYGAGRSAGTVRDLLAVLRIGGLTGLYQRGCAATGYRPPSRRRSFLMKPVSLARGFPSREEVEWLLLRYQAFDKDGAEVFCLPDIESPEYRVAAALSVLSRSVLHFPQVLKMCDPRSRLTLSIAALWTRAQWALVTRRVLPGCLAALGLLAPAHAQNHLYTFNGDSAGDLFGRPASGAGDVNRDGIPDLIVAAPFDDNNGTDSGSVRVFSGKDGKIFHTFNGDSAGDRFGDAVSDAGDVNNDGFDDIIVGARFDDNNGTDSGMARVFSGIWIAVKAGQPILYTFNGDSAGDQFGSVSGAGDVNKDGFADLIVGAQLDDNNGTDSGMARVFSGKDGKILYTFNGDSAGDRLGAFVSGAGDVNNDGFPDLIAGALFDDNNGTDSGMARVFSGKDGQILYTFNGDSAGDRLGSAVSGAGDVNNDGFADLIVGAYLDDNNGTDSGMARVFSGKDGKILYTFNGDSAGDKFGNSVSGAGDVNKDGYADLIVSGHLDDNNGTDSGMARVFSGKDGQILYTFNGDSAGDNFGLMVSDAGDVNNDGFADLIVGAGRDDNNGTDSGSVRVLSGKALSLTTDSHAFSLAKANTQILNLDAGTANKGRLYWVFGSLTGASPGVTLGSAIGPVTIPLNPDAWTDMTIALANSPVLVNTKGALDQNGQATAQIKGGPVNVPSAIGLVFYHAYLVYDASNNFYMASNPTTLLIEK